MRSHTVGGYHRHGIVGTRLLKGGGALARVGWSLPIALFGKTPEPR